jgi:tetratricopeptide (TPR) repeat protein
MKHHSPSAAALAVLAALLTCLCVGATAQPPAARQTRPAPQPPPRKKKIPPGARGFEQYAARDASDKLATGAATRGGAAQSLIEAGLERYQQNDLSGAAATFERAIRLAPDNAEAHYGLAIVLGELDRYEESAAEFRQALGCNPDDQQRLLATYNLGNAYLDMGKYREALARFQETARLDPKQPTPHYNTGLAYVALKDLEKAIDAFAQAVRLKDDYAEARFNLALAYWQSGRRQEARAERDSLRRLDAAQAARLDQLFR